VNAQHKAKKELLKDEIASLIAERLKLHDENQQLKEGLSDLSSAKQADVENIHHLQMDISQLKSNVLKVEGYVIDQHKFGFEKALQQVKYFYKISLDEGNFDVGKDFYNGELIPVDEIPYDDTPEEGNVHDHDRVDAEK